ncbi:2-C-methyl-D-erythritol 4-phosphate cytidylyltransferase [Enemella sp. A6]|uniref:2-C-methyl-D-erythritol 4-phosphate cytidylyltransferase n=1 Tax=Enemella sp. A6 TaxID=3440152 RepID=UPI003EBAF072
MFDPVVAVIVGAGLGLRFGGRTPKPALRLSGKAVLAMSVEAMAAAGCTHAVVVLNPKVAEKLGASLSASPIPVHQTLGGNSRQESVFNGLRVVHDHPTLSKAEVVLIHDAVRPMVPAHVAESVITAVREGADAVAPAVSVSDSMRVMDEDGTTRVIDRSTLRAIQTPQGFRLPVIWESHQQMASKPAEFTDDVSCAERAGYPVTLVPGSRLSMKITEPPDMPVARALWRARSAFGHHSGRRFRRLLRL